MFNLFVENLAVTFKDDFFSSRLFTRLVKQSYRNLHKVCIFREMGDMTNFSMFASRRENVTIKAILLKTNLGMQVHEQSNCEPRLWVTRTHEGRL